MESGEWRVEWIVESRKDRSDQSFCPIIPIGRNTRTTGASPAPVSSSLFVFRS